MKASIHISLLLALLLSGLIAWGMPFTNEDLFLAFCSGRDTIQGRLGHPDESSFVLDGKVWVDQSWLPHLVYYLSYVRFRDWGPVGIKGLLLLAYWMLLYAHCRTLGTSVDVALIALTAGTLALAPFLGIKGQNFGILLFVALAAILSRPGLRPRLQQISSLLILGIWSNCHASFMLGFVLIGLRFLIELANSLGFLNYLESPNNASEARTQKSDVNGRGRNSGQDGASEPNPRTGTADPVGWLGATLLALPVMAFANPYGPENLAIPFRQMVGASTMIPWMDWLPLLHLPAMFHPGILRPFSVWPFLILLVVVTGTLCYFLTSQGPKAAAQLLSGGGPPTGLLMAFATVLVLMPLVLKFRRMITFATPALVPVLALLLHVSWKSAEQECCQRLGKSHWACAGLSVSWLILLGVSFYRAIVIPYLPDNPTLPSSEPRTLVSRLMSYHFAWEGSGEFLQRNAISGNICASVFMSNYLLFRVPGIKVFLDQRAHSVYPAEVFQAYASIFMAGPPGQESPLDVLERYRVSAVVMDTRTTGFEPAVRLMASKKWACIYKDAWVFILAKADAGRFALIAESANVDGLWYGSDGAKLQSEAFLTRFMQGTIPEQLLERLVSLVQRNPDPNLYTLIVDAMNKHQLCLNQAARQFLESEVRGLSSTDYMVAGGEQSILQSLLRCLYFLANDERTCPFQGGGVRYASMRRGYKELLEKVRQEYGVVRWH